MGTGEIKPLVSKQLRWVRIPLWAAPTKTMEKPSHHHLPLKMTNEQGSGANSIFRSFPVRNIRKA